MTVMNHELKWERGMRWPPQCCVPAFVNAALIVLDQKFKAPQALPVLLDVKVLPFDDNPLGLNVAGEINQAGVSSKQAAIKLKDILKDTKPKLDFFYVGSNHVSFGLHEEFIKDILEQGAVIGLGLDYNILTSQTPNADLNFRHVLRVIGVKGHTIELFDDSFENEIQTHLVSLGNAILAMQAVNGGYWILGPANLKFKNSS